MDVQVGVVLLIGVGSFSLNQKHVVILDPEVEASWDANIVDTEAICFACYKYSEHQTSWTHGKHGGVTVMQIKIDW
jgi:hypothetical protein